MSNDKEKLTTVYKANGKTLKVNSHMLKFLDELKLSTKKPEAKK